MEIPKKHSLLGELSNRWKFKVIQEIPGLSVNYLAQVEIEATGELAMLKIAPSGSNIESELRWLRRYQSIGPEIYAFDELKNAFLMEMVLPGATLKSIVKNEGDELATRIFCQVVLDLQKFTPATDGFSHISEFRKDFFSLNSIADSKIVGKASSIFDELTSDHSNDRLLHGDLHHDNIIKKGPSWVVIDPQGCIGDPVAEIGVTIFSPIDAFPRAKSIRQTIEMRLKILANELPFDRKKIKAWAFCRSVLAAAWMLQDHGKGWRPMLEIASIIDGVQL